MSSSPIVNSVFALSDVSLETKLVSEPSVINLDSNNIKGYDTELVAYANDADMNPGWYGFGTGTDECNTKMHIRFKC